MSISFHADGIAAAYVKRAPAGMPTVELVSFYPGDSTSREVQLEKLTKEIHADRYRVTTLLADGEYQKVSVDAPNVPADELKTAIRWRLKDILDFHIDDATIDVIDIPVEKNAPARNHTMFAVAARNQLIEQRQTLFSEMKVSLSAIDIPEMAQRNISVLMEPEGRGVALLSFDSGGGLLTVTYAGELYLSRHIDVSLDQIRQAGADQKTALFDRITLELQRSLDHFDRQFHFISLAKLVLFPMVDAIAGLQEYLADNLYVPVETASLGSVVDLSKIAELQHPDGQRRYFLAIGAALRHEETAL